MPSLPLFCTPLTASYALREPLSARTIVSEAGADEEEDFSAAASSPAADSCASGALPLAQIRSLQRGLEASNRENARLAAVVEGQAAAISCLQSQVRALLLALQGGEPGEAGEPQRGAGKAPTGGLFAGDSGVSIASSSPFGNVASFGADSFGSANAMGTPPAGLKTAATAPASLAPDRCAPEEGGATPSFAALCSTFKLAAAKAGRQPSLQLHTPQGRSGGSRLPPQEEEADFSISTQVQTPRASRPAVH